MDGQIDGWITTNRRMDKWKNEVLDGYTSRQ